LRLGKSHANPGRDQAAEKDKQSAKRGDSHAA